MPRIEIEAPQPDYPLRASSFVSSITIHCIVATAITFLTIPPRLTRPVYDELIKPSKHQIVFYDFRRKVPDVEPIKKVGQAPEEHGSELSKQTVIATSRHPRSSQVLISVPAPEIHLENDAPVPILIARLGAIIEVPTPHQPRTSRRFVPPKVSNEQPQSLIQPLIVDTETPPLPSSIILSTAPTKFVTLPTVTAPPKNTPETNAKDPGSASVDLTVAALHPTENADTPIPRGDRPGSFSKAPTQGEAASGDINDRGRLAVPDLTVRNTDLAALSMIATEEILYTDRVRSVSVVTLSVPLRPSSRAIPAAVDAQFRGRNVYTIVIPMENIPAYAGDWILWFAERGLRTTETPVMRAPVPFRKIEPVDPASTSQRTRERIQFFATVGKNGKLDGIRLLTNTSAAFQHAVLEDLTAWEFQPATSDGIAVDVDVVVEVPFNLLLRTREERFAGDRPKEPEL